MAKRKWALPAWEGPHSPQSPVPVGGQECGHAVFPEDPDQDVQCNLEAGHVGQHASQCRAESPDYPGLTCNFVADHDGNHYALGNSWAATNA